jgi:geranylgeranyl transferase type-2 subunit alpha
VKRVNLSQEAKRLKLEKDKAKIATYKKLTEEVFELRDSKNHTLDAFDKTTALISLNPEFYTIWNYRREIMLDLISTTNSESYKKLLNEDLKLVMSILKRFPKCYWIWNHRRWCLFELVKIGTVDWNYEFAVVSKLLLLDARNFHGWQYRRFVVENIEKSVVEAPDVSPDEEKLQLLEINVTEFNFTTSKINSNLSNFSAWHNRSKLVSKVYRLFQELKGQIPEKYLETFEIFKSPYLILMHDLELVKTGMYMDSDDTSIWLYLSWLLTDKFFVEDLKNATDITYLEILNQQLEIVTELNELEKSDNANNYDHGWCLKTIIMLKGLIAIQTSNISSFQDLLTEDITSHLRTLITIDPLRKGRYLDQLAGKASILPNEL